MVREEVCHVVLSFLKGEGELESMNHIFIALVPKVKTPEMVSEYRPICVMCCIK